jgi:LPXTG-motif cell wall-anchored protein
MVLGMVSAAVMGFAAPASADGAPSHPPCNCSTTSSSTTTSSTTTTVPPTTTTTEVTSTSVGGVTSTMHTTTTFIDIGPPISVIAPTTTTTLTEQAVTSTTRDVPATDLLPHTGSSPFFPITFGLGCVLAGVVFALRRKPREWYGS